MTTGHPAGPAPAGGASAAAAGGAMGTGAAGTGAAGTGAAGTGAARGEYAPAAYGEDHARVYDRIYPSFPTDAAVARIAAMASAPPGAVLDLGIGTGRLALPLHAAGVAVEGIDASEAMIAELRSRPGGDAITVHVGDIADFAVATRFSVVVCAVSTLFMLPDADLQVACLRNARTHLLPGGTVVVEAFVPDPGRYDAEGRRVELRRFGDTDFHLVVSTHRPDDRTVTIVHVLGDGDRVARHVVRLHYATPEQLDAMAVTAGLVLVERTGGWDGRAFGPQTTDHVSVYAAARP